MGATDNAFIKAYRDSVRMIRGSARVKHERSGVHDNLAEITVNEFGPTISQVYASQDLPRPVATPSVLNVTPRTDAQSSQHSHVPAPHIPAAAFSAASPTAVVDQSPQHVTFVSATMDGKSAIDRRPPPTRTVTEKWLAEWEVDKFRWPTVCEKLNSKSTVKLSEVVRPILNLAWRGKNIMAVTSSRRGEGASTVALCLARMAASFKVPVVLVDGDLEHPSLGKSLGVSFQTGWNEGLPLRESAVSSVADRCVVLPATLKDAATDDDMTATSRMLRELRNSFELVIVDAGPIFTAARRWFSPPSGDQINSALIVRDLRDTAKEQIDDVTSRLGTAGLHEVAIIENFLRDAA